MEWWAIWPFVILYDWLFIVAFLYKGVKVKKNIYCIGMIGLLISLAFFTGCDDSSSDPEPICGNGVLETSEGCDDGNKTAGDGCCPKCAVELGWKCTKESGSKSLCEKK